MILATTPWKVKHPKNPILYFISLYLVLFVCYGFYAWGIAALMERVIFKERKWNESNVIGLFVVFTAGVLLVILNNRDVEKEQAKTRMLKAFVLAQQSLITQMFSIPSDTKEIIDLPGVPKTLYTAKTAMFETVYSVFIGVILLVWEYSSTTRNESEAREIINCLNLQTLGFRSNIPTTFARVTPVDNLLSGSWALSFVAFVNTRLTRLCDYKVFVDGSVRLTPAMNESMNACSAFINHSSSTTYWWINLAVRIFGVLYMLAVPFLLWTTQGILTIVWAEVVFVIVGSHIIYRFFISDVFTNPTKWDTGPVLNSILALGENADAWFKMITFDNNITIQTTFQALTVKYLDTETRRSSRKE